jgi:hypothetical protein
MRIMTIQTKREGYTPEQCGRTATVGDLIAYLSQWDEDLPVYLSNDNGYTYGSIREYDIDEEYVGDDDDEDTEEDE